MANNSAGVYDGLPFSYLSNTSPTEKQPPRSPRLSARSQSERGEPVGEARSPDEEAELKPFTYLTPNSPTERDIPSGSPTPLDQPDYFEPLPEEDQQRGLGVYHNPSFNANPSGRRLPRGDLEPRADNVRVGSDPNYYTSIKSGDINGQERINQPQYPPDHNKQLEPNSSAYGHSAYTSLPRPTVSGGLQGDPRDNVYVKPDYPNGDRNFEAMHNHQPTPRPLTHDHHYMDSGLKRREGCDCRVALMAVLLIVLALGAGFAAGWFVSKSFNDSTDNSGGSVDSNEGTAMTTKLMEALTTITTTVPTSSASQTVSQPADVVTTETDASVTSSTEVFPITSPETPSTAPPNLTTEGGDPTSPSSTTTVS